jgi:hypothetical protein
MPVRRPSLASLPWLPLVIPALAALAASGMFTGCAHLTAPAQNSGPTTAKEGVALALTGQSCFQARETDWPDDDLAELVVEVQVANTAGAPIAVERSNIRLWLPGGAELATGSAGAGEPLVVSGGESRRFRLRYMTRGVLRCASRLTLDTRGSVTLAGRVLDTGRIAFSPSQSL